MEIDRKPSHLLNKPQSSTRWFDSLVRLLDSIHYFDSLIQLESTHWFDSLFRFLDSTSCFNSMVRHIGSSLWFDSLAPLIDSILRFNFLFRLDGSTYWFEFLIRLADSIHWFDCRRLLESVVSSRWFDSLIPNLDSIPCFDSMVLEASLETHFEQHEPGDLQTLCSIPWAWWFTNPMFDSMSLVIYRPYVRFH